MLTILFSKLRKNNAVLSIKSDIHKQRTVYTGNAGKTETERNESIKFGKTAKKKQNTMNSTILKTQVKINQKKCHAVKMQQHGFYLL